MSKRTPTKPRKPPAFPKEQERRRFEEIIAGLKNLAKADERLIEQMEGLFEALETVESDGNARTRWDTYLRTIPDFSLKEAAARKAEIEVIQEKLKGEYTGDLEAEDIAGMKRKDLNKLAKEQFGVEKPGDFKLIDELRKHLVGLMEADKE